jgi:hypothetical protein
MFLVISETLYNVICRCSNVDVLRKGEFIMGNNTPVNQYDGIRLKKWDTYILKSNINFQI